MPTGAETIAKPTSSCKGDNAEQVEWRDQAPSSADLRRSIDKEIKELMQQVAKAAGRMKYEEFEADLITLIFRLGRRIVGLFLCLWEERTNAIEGH